jgi:hypothetical protein
MNEKGQIKGYTCSFLNLIICFTFLLFSVSIVAQTDYTISGVILEKESGETLFGASVYLKGTTNGVVTNEYGFYSITAPKGNYTLIVSYIGYGEMTREILIDKNQKLDFKITEASTELNEVVLTGKETERINLKKPEMSVSKLNIKTIKQMPVVLGEVDLIKSIQMLPGVTSSAEGTSGFHVRGGAVDQNLVLLDEAIIYNTSHLLGYVSVFNADAVKDIKLYKGGIPARFGGRVSSVLDVRQKNGNSERIALTGGVGLISSRLAVEGPLFGEKGSFMFAGRGSYATLFLKASKSDTDIGFYDLNLKTNYRLDENNKLFLSGYFGRDKLSFGNNFGVGYGNTSGNLRWNHVFNNKLFSNLSIIYGKYDYNIDFNIDEFEWVSSINNINLKYDLKYYLSNTFKLNFGASGIYYDFNPGQITPTSENSEVNPLKFENKRAFESALYISAEHKLTDKLTAQYGFRYSMFNRLGGQEISDYANDQPVIYNNTLGVYQRSTEAGLTNYDKNKTIKKFGNLEPRASLAYQLNESSSVKMGYSKGTQYVHLISNTNAVSPLDVWTPSGKYIKPQISNQFALGYFKNFKNKSYSLEIESYYKTVDNRLDYIDGSNLITNTIETEVLNGESRAYGLELLLRKNKGKFTGWFAYTLSKSEQKTLGGTAGGPGINNGKWYNASNDRTHDFSLTGNYQLNDKWSFGANFVFQTGRPVTYPDSQYEYEELSIANFSDRNSDRLAAYHRLDFSATYKPNRKLNKKWKGEWVFGIYNIYNRKNAAAVSFGQNLETSINEATRTSIFGIIPSITYNFKF